MMRTLEQQEILKRFMASDPTAVDRVKSALFERSPIIMICGANFVTGREIPVKPMKAIDRLAVCVLQEIVVGEGSSFDVLRFDMDADGCTFFNFLYWDGTKSIEEPSEIGVVTAGILKEGKLLMENDGEWADPYHDTELIPCEPIRQIRRRCHG